MSTLVEIQADSFLAPLVSAYDVRRTNSMHGYGNSVHRECHDAETQLLGKHEQRVHEPSCSATEIKGLLSRSHTRD